MQPVALQMLDDFEISSRNEICQWMKMKSSLQLLSIVT